EVVVVDDGSSDRTAEEARAAGARVVRVARRLGKGGAVEGALDRLASADVYLFVDGDIGASAAGVEPVLRAVVDGDADLAVGVLPPPRRPGPRHRSGGRPQAPWHPVNLRPWVYRRFPVVTNYQGRPVVVGLGTVLVAGVAWWFLLTTVMSWAADGDIGEGRRR